MLLEKKSKTTSEGQTMDEAKPRKTKLGRTDCEFPPCKDAVTTANGTQINLKPAGLNIGRRKYF